MQCIYNYIPVTNSVCRLYSVAAILWLQYMAHVMLIPMLNVLYIYISTSRSRCAAPNMAVVCSSLLYILLSLSRLQTRTFHSSFKQYFKRVMLQRFTISTSCI